MWSHGKKKKKKSKLLFMGGTIHLMMPNLITCRKLSLQCCYLCYYRQCVSASLWLSLTPSPGSVTAIAQWTPSFIHCSWETSNEPWGSSYPAAHLTLPGDHPQLCLCPSETLGSQTWPVPRLLHSPPILHILLQLLRTLSTCWTLHTAVSSYLCSCQTKWTLWTEGGEQNGKFK